MQVNGQHITLELGDEIMDRDPEVARIEAVADKSVTEISELVAAAGQAACGSENCCLEVATTITSEGAVESFYDPATMQSDSRPHSIIQLDVGVSCLQGYEECEAQITAATEYLSGFFGEALDVHQEADGKAQSMRSAADAVSRGIRAAAEQKVLEVREEAELNIESLKTHTYAPLRDSLTVEDIQAGLAGEPKAQ